VEFVEDQRTDARKLGVGLDHPGQDALGHDLDAGGLAAARLAAHAIADGLARYLAQGLGQPFGGSAGGQAAGFQHHDAALGQASVQQRQGHARGLARAGRGLQHGAARAAQGGDQIGQDGVDGKGLCHDALHPVAEARSRGPMDRRAPLGHKAGMEMGTLAERIRSGDRRALARAITLVESARADHRAQAAALFAALASGDSREALRIGLSGTPGVGKSSFIEAFGLMLTGQGKRVAVLAVDPSSSRSGGSILGDKTRMERLSRDPLAYIRPSPSTWC